MPHARRRPSIRSWARPPPDPADVTTYRVCRVAPPSDPRQLCARRYQKLRSAGANGPHHVVEPNCRPPELPPAYPLFLIPQTQPGQKNVPAWETGVNRSCRRGKRLDRVPGAIVIPKSASHAVTRRTGRWKAKHSTSTNAQSERPNGVLRNSRGTVGAETPRPGAETNTKSEESQDVIHSV